MRSLAGIVALMAVFTLAIGFILIGSISEEIKARLGIDNSAVGSLAMALFLTSLAVQLFVGLLVDKLGHKIMAIVGFLATSAAIFLLAAATNLNAALTACSLLGVGAMCVNTVGNTLLPIVLFEGKEPARASNFGNGFVGLAFVLTPTGAERPDPGSRVRLLRRAARLSPAWCLSLPCLRRLRPTRPCRPATGFRPLCDWCATRRCLPQGSPCSATSPWRSR